MNDLNCSKIIKENSKVLSWNDDIQVMYYQTSKEIIRANMCVHMNMISIVLQGTKEILGCGMKRVVPAGSGFFMKKGSYLVSDKIEDEEKDYESIIIFFSDTWLQSQIDTIFDCKNTSDTQGEDCLNGDIALLEEDKLMNSVIDQLKSYFELSQDKERLQILLPFKIRELFQILISAPNGYHFEKRLRSLDNHHNPDLVVLMQNNYKENISLEQYAFLANCSLSTFKRKFMQTFKTNPGKWIMQRRLEESYELLKKSEKNVTEIAYEVGFETPAHFIASFKQKYRNTPKQLQKQL
ncbi:MULTISPECIES: AraC family transcriptional regulator [Chryseobacterium]|uniref:helix-turn-helix domain-containing protein n=2 Tax=Flavobacteriales TaxID=200644 RepID=UPI001D13A741|nr:MULTISPECIES: AraC family transcriptional regulator [unclassified Chryseobacterium]MCC3215609.1 AraC family transcriptional regulator [Chryseobacterium sp. X308]WFB67393.1 AraC family transcriptional regulator [Chryseobacterium sp. WX]